MKKITEINEYEYKGIKVIVYIDHILGKVSLMEKDTSRSNCEITYFKKKEFVFGGRGLEYMRGWQTILDAVKYAVTEATKLLEHDLAESSKFKDEMVLQSFKTLKEFNDAIEKKNKPKKKK